MLGVMLPGAVGVPGRGDLTCLMSPDAVLCGVSLTAHSALDGVSAAALQVVMPLAPVAPQGLLVIVP